MWENGQQKQNSAYQCSFCKKRYDQPDRLTAGPGNLFICDECVGLYRRHLEERAGDVLPQATIIASIVVLNLSRKYEAINAMRLRRWCEWKPDKALFLAHARTHSAYSCKGKMLEMRSSDTKRPGIFQTLMR